MHHRGPDGGSGEGVRRLGDGHDGQGGDGRGCGGRGCQGGRGGWILFIQFPGGCAAVWTNGNSHIIGTSTVQEQVSIARIFKKHKAIKEKIKQENS
jgi:hypothetical protein